MRIGVPTEIKVHEYRVGLVPTSVRELVEHGHEVCIESGAGRGVGCEDSDYETAGARILADASAVFSAADMIVKVKEPQAVEVARLRPEQTLFTYLHLAADPAQARGLMASGATAIAYETVTAADRSLPLLTPMSEVAGRMSIQVGATCLQKANGGSGLLLAGVPGVAPARVVILGGGVAGASAARMAIGLRADVTILDLSLPRLRALDVEFQGSVRLIHATRDAVERAVLEADLVIGAVLIPGAAAPRLVTREMLERMRDGSAVVDIAIDQGGCFESSRPTTHSDPTYMESGVVHYCVTNMPGAVARTSTYALNAVTLPFIVALADRGVEAALAADPHLRAGLNVQAGRIMHPAVEDALRGKLGSVA